MLKGFLEAGFMGKVLTFLLIIALLLVATPQTAVQGSRGLDLKIFREVDIRSGYMVLKDYIYLNNTGRGDEAFVVVGLPVRYVDKVFSIYAYMGHGRLRIEQIPLRAGLTGFKIVLPQALKPGEALNLTLTMVLYEVFKQREPYPGAPIELSVELPLYPSMLYECSSLDVSIMLPEGSRDVITFPPLPVSIINERQVIKHKASPLPPLSERDLKIFFKAEMVLIRGLEASREVNLGGSSIKVVDFLTIRNFGNTTLKAKYFKVKLLPGADEVSVSDDLGWREVRKVPGKPEEPVEVEVALRYDLKPGFSYAFKISYNLPPIKYVSKMNETYVFTLPSKPFYEFPINLLRLKISLPEGALITEGKVKPEPMGIEAHGAVYVVTYEMRNVTLDQIHDITISYQASSYWPYVKLSIYILPILILISLGALAYRYKAPAKVVMALPTPVLKDFCVKYDEKISLILELKRLEEDLRKRRMKMGVYRQRSGAVKRDIAKLESEISILKEKVRTISPRHARIVDELEEAEAELRSSESSLRELERQRLAKRISRRVYEDLKLSYMKKARKAEARINGIILSLREEA